MIILPAKVIPFSQSAKQIFLQQPSVETDGNNENVVAMRCATSVPGEKLGRIEVAQTPLLPAKKRQNNME
jgi:hypothetical protein